MLKTNTAKPASDHFEGSKLKLAVRLCILLCLMFGVMAVLELRGKGNYLVLDLFCFSLSFLFLLYLKLTGKYRPVYFVASIAITLISAYSLNYFLDDTHLAVFLWMIYAVMLAYWGVGLVFGGVILGLNIISAIGYHLFSIEANMNSLRPIDAGVKTGLIIEMVVAMSAIALLLYQFVRNYQISLEGYMEANRELQRNNDLIEAKNKENIFLLKEVHHRVKNNLQIIISLLRLQSGGLPPDAEERFEEAISRIMTMALIHRKLYQSDDLSRIEIDSYVNDLASVLSDNKDISLSVDSDVRDFGLKTIVPLGLMINELLSNSFKHAFKGQDKGSIVVVIRSLPNNEFTLVFSDTGVWRESSSGEERFGMELIRTLTDQMEGKMNRTGSRYEFHLRNLDI